jgi:small-conductance mechanosensitive channel
MFDSLLAYFTAERMLSITRATLLFVVGLIAARLISRVPERLMARRFTRHHVMIARRATYYGVLALFVASALSELGFGLHILLGAAGVLSVAIGFASQTSASNLISGLFLIGERPFEVGDTIAVGSTTGEVLSIDLLSVKLRTADNLYVRIPNETLIKAEVTTLTRFPVRRFDLDVGVAYKADIARVRDLLMQAAARNPLCMDEPKPVFVFKGFGESTLNLQLSVWTRREDVAEARNSLQEEVKRAFDAAGIDMPFPHRTLYAAADTPALPVRLVGDEGEGR